MRRAWNAAIHFGLEEMRGAAAGLGAVERGHVGVAQQRIRRVTVARRQCDADAGADDELVTVCSSYGLLTTSISRLASLLAWLVGSPSGYCTTANSSPPSRATISVSRGRSAGVVPPP